MRDFMANYTKYAIKQLILIVLIFCCAGCQTVLSGRKMLDLMENL